jgi:DNA-3-methyladenine glycosylase II
MRQITRKIIRLDENFAPIIKASPLCSIGQKAPKKYQRSHFEILINSIISQQLATKAADTIIERVRTLGGGKITPESMRDLGASDLRSAGVSGAKARAIHELTSAVHLGEINFHKFPRMANHEISKELTALWGIGRWTVEMFLMFHLGRLDVWPVGDLAMRRGWEKIHRLRKEIEPKKLDVIGQKFDGFQSVVAWYCWRATEGESSNW